MRLLLKFLKVALAQKLDLALFNYVKLLRLNLNLGSEFRNESRSFVPSLLPTATQGKAPANIAPRMGHSCGLLSRNFRSTNRVLAFEARSSMIRRCADALSITSRQDVARMVRVGDVQVTFEAEIEDRGCRCRFIHFIMRSHAKIAVKKIKDSETSDQRVWLPDMMHE